jgi:hypothetical protein
MSRVRHELSMKYVAKPLKPTIAVRNHGFVQQLLVLAVWPHISWLIHGEFLANSWRINGSATFGNFRQLG